MKIERHSDFSVLVTFSSCRMASEFERKMSAPTLPSPKVIAYRVVGSKTGEPKTDWIDGSPDDDEPIFTNSQYQLAYDQPSPAESDDLSIDDYKEVIADKHRLTAELSKILMGDDSPKQPSLCDLVSFVRATKNQPSQPIYAIQKGDRRQINGIWMTCTDPEISRWQGVEPSQLSGNSGELTSDTEMLDWMECHRAEIEEGREGWKVMWLDENGDVLSTDGEYCHQREAIKAAMQAEREGL
ncbi:MAG TPA: hypothetical protein DD666_00585 [Advenella kashmirensis]|uniref:Uncharacterized protein n=1 Tax=Advenella kashmirensis TaxID=310575 RepID=A0A356LBK3_9BURK|nr:hypothetical protein [Advenella kashmirensis]